MTDDIVIVDNEDIVVVSGEPEINVVDLTVDIFVIEVTAGGTGSGGGSGVSGPDIYAFAARHG